MLTSAILANNADGFSRLWHFLVGGGEVMFLILLCSIISVTIIILKALQLRQHVLFPKRVLDDLSNIERYANRGDITPLQQRLERSPSVAAQLGLVAISGKYESREESTDACETAARGIMHRLEAGVPLLEVIVTVSPLLGLLGAVIGLVTVFSAFGGPESANADTTQVARGIAEALHSTIAGLLVAIPTVIAHGYFSRRLDAIAVSSEALIRQAIHDFHRHFEVRPPNTFSQE
jgi:biopolymer transport protein ExbB